LELLKFDCQALRMQDVWGQTQREKIRDRDNRMTIDTRFELASIFGSPYGESISRRNSLSKMQVGQL
jgi:hypothetical protein